MIIALGAIIYFLIAIIVFIFVYIVLLSEFKTLLRTKLISAIIAILWPLFIAFLIIMFLLSKAVPRDYMKEEDI